MNTETIQVFERNVTAEALLYKHKDPVRKSARDLYALYFNACLTSALIAERLIVIYCAVSKTTGEFSRRKCHRTENAARVILCRRYAFLIRNYILACGYDILCRAHYSDY